MCVCVNDINSKEKHDLEGIHVLLAALTEVDLLQHYKTSLLAFGYVKTTIINHLHALLSTASSGFPAHSAAQGDLSPLLWTRSPSAIGGRPARRWPRLSGNQPG